MVSDKLLNAAAAEALKGIKSGEGGPFGAVIVRGKRVVAIAHNTVLKTMDPTNHAEMNAIRIAAKKFRSPFLTGCTIYSTTEPCPMCFSAIHWAQISNLIYSTTIQDVAKLGFNELALPAKFLRKKAKLKIKIRQQKNISCLNLLKAWQLKENKQLY